MTTPSKPKKVLEHVNITCWFQQLKISCLIMSFREGYSNHGYFLITEITSSKHLSTGKLEEILLKSLWMINILNDEYS